MKDKSKYLGNELKYIEMVLNSQKWSSTEGSWTNNLEKQFAKKFNSKYAIAMNSGTSTLHASLIAAGVESGDEVITPALTVIMDTSAIIHANAIPVYADVEENSFNIDVEDVRKKITSKTKAIIAVSLYGLPCDMKNLLTISKEYGNIIIIEDNAQYMGKHRSHITSYSFENSKHISCGEGGIALTNNEEMAKKIRSIGNHGFKNSEADEGRTKLDLDIFQNPSYKRHNDIGWNYRMSEFSSAITLAQLEKVEETIEKRMEVSKIFREVLSGYEDFVLQKHINEHNYWSLAVRFLKDEKEWVRFRKMYVKNGGDGIYGAWSVPYMEPVMSNNEFRKRCPQIYKNISYDKGLCPIAEKIQPQIMQFKLNYRDLDLAKRKSELLDKTLREYYGI